MSSIDAIIDVSIFSKWIGLQTVASNTAFTQQLNDWKSDKNQLQHLSTKCKRFKDAFERDPELFGKCNHIFGEIAAIEEKLTNMIYNDSELERESYSEILFFKPMFQMFNFVPYVLSIWAFIRIYVLPGISLLIPILTLIAPYLIIKSVFHIPMTFTNYMTILHSMMSGTFDKLKEDGFDMNDASSMNSLTSNIVKQIGLAIVTILQGIVQPYWTHTHLKSVDNIIQENGSLILQFRTKYEELSQLLGKHGFTFFKCPLPNIDNQRDATARVILESSYFKLALKYIGSLEVLMCLAHHNDIYPVRWVSSSTPVFCNKDAFDFHLEETSKRITVNLSAKRHALLTGPNKGGKSTVLRALSINALLAHTYGCAIGKLTLTPFERIFVCLKPDDLPGSKSRFEREIEFTASTLQCKGPILVFIDELYHSTNPPDALRSCEIYCNQLWNKRNAISIISTHLFELVDKSPQVIQRLCCPATVNEDGIVTFLYSLEEGVCKVSSVDTLLQRNGLTISLPSMPSITASYDSFKNPLAVQNE